MLSQYGNDNWYQGLTWRWISQPSHATTPCRLITLWLAKESNESLQSTAWHTSVLGTTDTIVKFLTARTCACGLETKTEKQSASNWDCLRTRLFVQKYVGYTGMGLVEEKDKILSKFSNGTLWRDSERNSRVGKEQWNTHYLTFDWGDNFEFGAEVDV